jgi:hypothetical protein
MSIKVSTKVWQCSRHRSGNLLVLLALADHADDQGTAWPSIRRLAREARLSERHTRRCLTELAASGEVEIFPHKAPSGKTLYKIRLDQLNPDDLSVGTSASAGMTSVSANPDAGDYTYIKKPSIKSSEEPSSRIDLSGSKQERPSKPHRSHTPDSFGLISEPKNGF